MFFFSFVFWTHIPLHCTQEILLAGLRDTICNVGDQSMSMEALYPIHIHCTISLAPLFIFYLFY